MVEKVSRSRRIGASFAVSQGNVAAPETFSAMAGFRLLNGDPPNILPPSQAGTKKARNGLPSPRFYLLFKLMYTFLDRPVMNLPEMLIGCTVQIKSATPSLTWYIKSAAKFARWNVSEEEAMKTPWREAALAIMQEMKIGPFGRITPVPAGR